MHNCPECGQACGCSGDLEDHDTGDEYMVECTHYLTFGCCDPDHDDAAWMPDAFDEPDSLGG